MPARPWRIDRATVRRSRRHRQYRSGGRKRGRQHSESLSCGRSSAALVRLRSREQGSRAPERRAIEAEFLLLYQPAGYPTDLISVYWSNPATPFWRPTPLYLYPPNGVSAPYGAPPLTPTKPALIRRAPPPAGPRRPGTALRGAA